jgi:hypothetical protein
MPVTVSYPGVYVEEIPSGVRTITGVATSVTAFIGRARRGPTDRAVEINSFGDFERIFGGLSLDSPMSYAVRDFYLNGGSDAVIVRLFHSLARDAADATAKAGGVAGDAAAVVTAIEQEAAKYTTEPAKSAADKVAKDAKTAGQGGDADAVRAAAEDAAKDTPTERARLTVGGLKLAASSEGLWGSNLRATVDKHNISDDVAAALGVAKADLFNLTVRDAGPGGATEKFLNLTAGESARRVDRVLANESQLVRWDGPYPDAPPNVSADSDPVTDAEADLAAKKKVVEGEWIPLEDGIEVYFGPTAGGAGGVAPATYRAGDYWLIPARVATRGIEWPQKKTTAADGPVESEPRALPPRGIVYHFAPIAVVALRATGVDIRGDCRCEFDAVNDCGAYAYGCGDLGIGFENL